MPEINAEKKNAPAPTLELLATLYTLDQLKSYVHDRPQIALAGRSNVGKSSVINRLVNRKNLAYVGASPGKTTQINYFLIDQGAYLVDLPGYGYAKVSKAEKERA